MVKCRICNATEKSGVVLFEAPKDAKRREVWSEACGLSLIDVVCQKHFKSEDFRKNTGKVLKLKALAVPTNELNKKTENRMAKDGASLLIKAEPEFVFVETDFSIKEEPIECLQQNESNNEEFLDLEDPINTVDEGTNTLNCGRITISTTSDGKRNYQLVCDHCQKKFDTSRTDFWQTFVTHLDKAHQGLPIVQKTQAQPPTSVQNVEVVKEIPTASVKTKELPPILDAINTTQQQQNTTTDELNSEKEVENNNESTAEEMADKITHKDDDVDNEMEDNNVNCTDDFEDSGDEAYEPNNKRRRKSTITSTTTKVIKTSPTSSQAISDKNNNILTFEHPDKKCVITFLELLTTRSLLWHSRQSIVKRFDELILDLTTKLNELHPKYDFTKDQIRQSIYRIKSLYQRILSDNQKRRTKISMFKIKYPEYIELCAEIEENSKSIIQKCDICESRNFVQTFYNPIDLQIHKYKYHRVGELPYKCQRCCYGFSCPDKLAQHESVHNRVKNFNCEFCSYAFYDEKKLQAHMVLHTDDSKKICEICGKTFPTLSKYRRHKLHHESPKEKCEICGKLYYEKWTLSEHMKSHRNERQYKCDICGKCFNRQEGVAIHKRGVHKIKAQTKKYVWVNRVTNTSQTRSAADNEASGRTKGNRDHENIKNEADEMQNFHSNSNSSSYVSETQDQTTTTSNNDVKPDVSNSGNYSQFPMDILNSLY